ncbi:gas vesicle protein GvpN [Bacillus daqingensis]|uniref:Gas vesicle protein GvpN n=1 Tax=Bacillus daqingensis TaxID=872396 RepID=A0ABV9NSC6_9BACI
MAAQKQAQTRREISARKSGGVRSAPSQSLGKPAEKKQEPRKPVREQASYIKTDEINHYIHRISRVLEAGYPVHVTGRAGAGKTALAMEAAKSRGRPVTLITGNHEMNNEDLLGGITGVTSTKLVDNFIRQVYKKEVNIKEDWTPGRLVEACEKGHTVIYDEFSRSTAETNNLFLSILEEGLVPLYGTKQKKRYVQVHPDFRILFTSNPEEYAGVFEKQDALMDRLVTMEVHYTQKTMETIIQKRAEVRHKDAKMIWSLLRKIKDATDAENGFVSLRSALMITSVAKKANIALEPDNKEFTEVCTDILSGELVRFGGAPDFQQAATAVRKGLKEVQGE